MPTALKSLPATYYATLDARMHHRLDLPRGAAAERLGLSGLATSHHQSPPARSLPHRRTPRSRRRSSH